MASQDAQAPAMQQIAPDELQGQLLFIAYVPLDQVILWEQNPKEHDIGGIMHSIDVHGFRDAPQFDGTAGHIVAGHGRATALYQRRKSGKEAPPGIGVHPEHGWCVPIQFGVDAPSVAAARAYAVASNSLVIAGGWDIPALAQVLEGLRSHELQYPDAPVLSGTGLDDEAIADVLAMASPPSLGALAGEYGDPKESDFWPVIRLKINPTIYTEWNTLYNQFEGDDSSRIKQIIELVRNAV